MVRSAKLRREFESFLKEVGFAVSLSDADTDPLPHYLSNRYDLFSVKAGERYFLGVVPTDPASMTPANLEKDIARLMAATNAQSSCLVLGDLPAYTRSRLVDRRIPFVIPGVQIYWPEMGSVLQEKSRKYRARRETNSLSPATQAVVTGMLLRQLPLPASSKDIATRLGYSPMTVSRALDEIEVVALANVEKIGRQRMLGHRWSRRELWYKALPFLQSPVSTTERYLIQESEHLIKAGESALSEQTMLAQPAEPEYAIDRGRWKSVGKTFEPCPVADHNTCRVQVWKYDPALFAMNGVVDPFSLFLSLREEPDDRVESALEDMIGSLSW